MLIEIIGEWAIVLLREDDRFFCVGRLSALNLFLSTKGDRFLGMAIAMHFSPTLLSSWLQKTSQ
jgi:hypothetical protein